MDKEHSLGEFERLVLLAVLRRHEDAYGYSIQQELATTIGRTVTLGAIYTTLERMEKKGLVSSRLAETCPGRGGRPKRLFTVKAMGIRALNLAHREWEQLAAGLEAVIGIV